MAEFNSVQEKLKQFSEYLNGFPGRKKGEFQFIVYGYGPTKVTGPVTNQPEFYSEKDAQYAYKQLTKDEINTLRTSYFTLI